MSRNTQPLFGTDTHTHSHRHTHTQRHIHTHTQTHKHTHTHTYTQTHTHTHRHTHSSFDVVEGNKKRGGIRISWGDYDTVGSPYPLSTGYETHVRLSARISAAGRRLNRPARTFGPRCQSVFSFSVCLSFPSFIIFIGYLFIVCFLGLCVCWAVVMVWGHVLPSRGRTFQAEQLFVLIMGRSGPLSVDWFTWGPSNGSGVTHAVF